MRELVAVFGLLILALSLVWLRPAAERCAPPPLPAASCQPWMADAIPGVGAKSREAVATAIRGGDTPAAARDWFSGSAR